MKEGKWEVLIRSWEVGDARWVVVPDPRRAAARESGWATDPVPNAERIYSLLRAAGRNLRIRI